LTPRCWRFAGLCMIHECVIVSHDLISAQQLWCCCRMWREWSLPRQSDRFCVSKHMLHTAAFAVCCPLHDGRKDQNVTHTDKYQQPFCLAVLVQGAWSLPNLHSHQELYPAIDTEMVPGYSVNNETTTCTFSPRPATHYHRHRRWSRIRAATTELHNVNAALDHMHLTKIRSDQIRSDQVRSGFVRSGKVRSGEVR